MEKKIEYPTSSKLWLSEKCPAWHLVKFIGDEAPGSSKAALFGVYLHGVAENEFRRQLGLPVEGVLSNHLSAIEESEKNPYFDKDISPDLEPGDWGANIQEMVSLLIKTYPPNKKEPVYIEQAFSIGKTGLTWLLDAENRKYGDSKNREICGTTDIAYWTPNNELVIVDWKTGKEPVEPKENPQLELAARCMYVPGMTAVHLIIGDVRNGLLKVHSDYAKNINERVDVLADKIFNASKEDLTPGVHCDRCPKAAYCPALAKLVTKQDTPPEEWSDDVLAMNAIMARKAAKSYRDLLVERAEKNKDFKSKYLTLGPRGWRLSGKPD